MTASCLHSRFSNCYTDQPLPQGTIFGPTASDASATLRSTYGDHVRTTCTNGRPGAGTRVGALDRFYHFALTQAQLAAMRNSAPDIPNLQTASAGDFAALVAMHVTTKEIPDWIWATFWWHDRLDEGTFAMNRPPEVKGTWRNYLMAEAYSMDTPRQSDGSQRIAFNPWLEARFPHGTASNCMTCHRRAVFSGKPSDRAFLPVTRGTPPSTGARFSDTAAHERIRALVLDAYLNSKRIEP